MKGGPTQNKMTHNRMSATMRAMMGMGMQSRNKPTMKKPQVSGRGRGFLGKKMRNRMEA